jgi:hypothetical protein
MPVEVGFCSQCREIECEDPDACARARTCQQASDALRDLADLVENSYDLADLVNRHGRVGLALRAGDQDSRTVAATWERIVADVADRPARRQWDRWVITRRFRDSVTLEVHVRADVIEEGTR